MNRPSCLMNNYTNIRNVIRLLDGIVSLGSEAKERGYDMMGA